MKHTTFVWEHPEVSYQMITSAELFILAKKKLWQKCKDHGVPTKGWKLVHMHQDENSDPSMDQNVQYTDWEGIIR